MSIRLGRFSGYLLVLLSYLIRLHRQSRFVTRGCVLVHDALLDRLVDH